MVANGIDVLLVLFALTVEILTVLEAVVVDFCPESVEMLVVVATLAAVDEVKMEESIGVDNVSCDVFIADDEVLLVAFILAVELVTVLVVVTVKVCVESVWLSVTATLLSLVEVGREKTVDITELEVT